MTAKGFKYSKPKYLFLMKARDFNYMPCSGALFGLEVSKLCLEGPLWSLDYIGGFTYPSMIVLLYS